MSKYRVLDDNKNKYDGEVLTSVVTPETAKGFKITSDFGYADYAGSVGNRYLYAYNPIYTFDTFNLNPSGGSYTETDITALKDTYLNGLTINSNEYLVALNAYDLRSGDDNVPAEFNFDLIVKFINKTDFDIRVSFLNLNKTNSDDIDGEVINDSIDLTVLDNVVITANSTKEINMGNLHIEEGPWNSPYYYYINWNTQMNVYRVID